MAAFGLLLLLCAAVYGSQVFAGGFYTDDWNNEAIYQFPTGTVHHGGTPGFPGSIPRFDDANHWRPVLPYYLPLTHWALGASPSLHLAWAIVLTAFMAAAFYWLLRSLRLERLHAGVMGALVAFFPATDSMTLWSTASVTRLSLGLYLLGLVCAVRGLRSVGGKAVAWHAGAIALYLLSVASYEATAAIALMSFLLYAFVGGRQAALRRLPFDVVALLLLIVTYTSSNPADRQPGISGMIEHAIQIAGGAFQVLGTSVVPGLPWIAGLLVAAGILMGVLAIGRARPGADPDRRRWLFIAGAGVIVVALGYVMFVPGPSGDFEPPGAGITERNNIVAAFGFVLIVYSLAMLAGSLAGRRRALLAGGLVAALFGAYVASVQVEKGRWARAAAIQNRVLTLIGPTLRDASAGSTVFVFGQPGSTAPNVPVFSTQTDLTAAAKVVSGNPGLEAQAVLAPMRVTCGPTGMEIFDTRYTLPPLVGSYGGLHVADAARGSVERVTDRERCEALLPDLHPGPLIGSG